MAAEGMIRLMAVGDVMLGDSSHFLGRGTGTRIRRDGPQAPWQEVADLLGQADLFLANLESPLAAAPGASTWERVYRGSAAAAEGLRRGTRNAVTLANNHILERGAAVLAETKAALDAHGVAWAGFDQGGGHGEGLRTWRQNGLSVALLAASVVPDRTGQPRADAGVEDDLVRSLAGAEADVRIVSVHWGDEYAAAPSAAQRSLARRLTDAGATLIVGHHPHVLQPVERLGDALVAYSLGNFLFDHDWSNDTRRAGVLDVTLTHRRVEDWRIVPTGRSPGGRPRPLQGAAAAWVAARVAADPAVADDEYRRRLAAACRRHRVAMKLELLRHLTSVSADTWLFLATKRRRPRPPLAPVAGREGSA